MLDKSLLLPGNIQLIGNLRLPLHGQGRRHASQTRLDKSQHTIHSQYTRHDQFLGSRIVLLESL